jgi:NAD(P)-dependent dehydrogenase (short-subunit alcohol dehydrogenase family)
MVELDRSAKGLGRLQGKSAVVTGAAKGIGRATAEVFAREGARLVITDVDEEGLTNLQGQLEATEIVVGDVSVPEEARRMIGRCVERYGSIDVLVANAGLIPLNNVVEATPEDWDRVMAVDGRGMFLTCKYAVEEMLKSGGGSIVCLSSISGLAGQKEQSTYGPAKFVASGITKHLAVEWADRGIRVNAVAACQKSRAERSISKPSSVCTRWDVSGSRRRWRRLSSFSPPRRPRSSPGPYCPWMAATWPSKEERRSLCRRAHRV